MNFYFIKENFICKVLYYIAPSTASASVADVHPALLREEKDIQESCHCWTPANLFPLWTTYQFIFCSNAKYITPHPSCSSAFRLPSTFVSFHLLNTTPYNNYPPSSPVVPPQKAFTNTIFVFSQTLCPLNHPCGSVQLQASAICNANMISSWNETCKCAVASPYPQWVPIWIHFIWLEWVDAFFLLLLLFFFFELRRIKVDIFLGLMFVGGVFLIFPASQKPC